VKLSALIAVSRQLSAISALGGRYTAAYTTFVHPYITFAISHFPFTISGRDRIAVAPGDGDYRIGTSDRVSCLAGGGVARAAGGVN
jgi:hypothetical protein